MTATERLKAERRIDELLAEAHVLRIRLRIDEFRQAGEPVPDAWLDAEQIVNDRHARAKAMADAVFDGKPKD